MPFTVITQAEVQPDQPVTTTLMDKIRTNFDDHEQRLSSGLSAIGEIPNPSFETPQGSYPTWPDRWSCSNGVGGLVQLSYDSAHGARAVQVQHNQGGGGGAYVETDYIGVSACDYPPIAFFYKATVAALTVQVLVRYFAADGAGLPSTYLGQRVVYTNVATNPLFYTPIYVTVPMGYPTARFVKFQLVAGAGATLGSAYFDGCRMMNLPEHPGLWPGKLPISPRLFSNGVVSLSNWITAWTQVATVGVTIPTGLAARYLVLSGYGTVGSYTSAGGDPPVESSHWGKLRFDLASVAGRYSSELVATGVAWTYGAMTYDLTGVAAGNYTLRMFFSSATPGNTSYGWSAGGAAGKEYFSSGSIAADGLTGTFTEMLPS